VGRIISQKFIDELEPPTQDNFIVYDSKLRGFGVRITSAGVKSFVLNYRVNGRERRYTIARCEDLPVTAAKAEAEKLRGDIAKGIDPLEAKRKEVAAERGLPTFSDLTRAYLSEAEKDKRASSLRNDRSMLNTILLPQLGERAAAEISTDDLVPIHQSLKSTPYRANRVLALASAIFSWALKRPERKEKFGVTDNPARGISRYHEDKREAWLSTEQLESFERALQSYSEQDAADALRLLILTGAREGEVLKATWDQFDLARQRWTKPSHHTKQKKEETIPLSEAAVRILKRMAANKSGPYLFPVREADSNRVTLRRPWVQVCKAAGLATEIRIQGKRLIQGKPRELLRYKPTVRIHDLRHTYASHLVSKGQSLHIVGRLLGHTRPETTARYAHIADEALRAATNDFGAMLKSERAKPTKKAPSRQRPSAGTRLKRSSSGGGKWTDSTATSAL